LLCAARSFSATAQVLAATLGGFAGLLATVVLVAVEHGADRELTELLAVSGTAVCFAVTLLRLSPESQTQTRRWLGRLETAVLFVCPIAILGVLDVYRLVGEALA
jgi:zinc transporter ZupT